MFVSRARFDLLDHNSRVLIAQLRADLAAAGAALERERDRYDALLQTTLAMKAKGADAVPTATGVVVPMEAPPAQPVDELTALIHEQCGQDYRKRGMMLRQLRADRAANRDPDAIRRDIEQGVQSDGVPA